MATRPNGTICDDSEAFDERGILKDGYGLPFRIHLMDSRPNPAALFRDAKADEPKTIDEALKAAFKLAAEQQGFKSTTEYLTQLKPAKLEEIAADVATKFVAAAGGAGVAAQFADSLYSHNTARTEAWRQYNAAVRDAHEAGLSTAYLGDRSADDRAVRDAALAARSDPPADPKAAYEAAMSGEKARISDAWRRPEDGASIREVARSSHYDQA